MTLTQLTAIYHRKLGDNVCQMVRERGLTNEDFSIRSGVPLSTLQTLFYNRNIRGVTFQTLVGIAKGLDMPLSELLRQVGL